MVQKSSKKHFSEPVRFAVKENPSQKLHGGLREKHCRTEKTVNTLRVKTHCLHLPEPFPEDGERVWKAVSSNGSAARTCILYH